MSGVVRGATPFGANSSPAAQRYLEWQRKQALRRQYDDIASALGLSQDQAGKLVDVLADREMRVLAGARPTFMDTSSFQQELKDRKARQTAEIAAIIGPDKIPQWEAYQRTLPERMQVNAIREQMQTMGVPITDEQRAQLLDIMVEQRESNPPPLPTAGLAPEDQMRQSMKWQEDSERALLERAKSVLSPEQFQRYSDFQAFQTEMRNNAMRAFRPPGAASVNTVIAVPAIPEPPPK